MALQTTAVNRITWQQLQSYMPAGAQLTSCYRSAEEQLNIIATKAKAKGYKFTKPPTVADESSWSGALAHVRKAGVKVAAPGRSAHQQGYAYDISGADLTVIEGAVRRAVAEGLIRLVPGSRSALLIEPHNNCVHVEIEQVVLRDDRLNTFAIV